ncbi:DUF3293 domain-containing protein [Acetobacteraceae bacterium H6797]|nr:DUF3293 domain-containing protein [Acetobacteraceae bacterium H6797]
MTESANSGAYSRAEYEVNGAIARIGRRSRAMDAVLAGLGARRGVIVTAWNPMSRRLAPRLNAHRAARLRAMVPGPVGEGLGTGPGRRPAWQRDWVEAHLLIPGPPRRAMTLAARFRQAAVVVVVRGQPARLVTVTR